MENDTTLLRPIPVGAETPIEALCWFNGSPLLGAWGPLVPAVLKHMSNQLRLKPLFWLDGRPVYPDDVLVLRCLGSPPATGGDAYRLKSRGFPLSLFQWPTLPEKEEELPPCGESVIEIYLDGERLFCEALPREQAENLAAFVAGSR